MLVIAAAGYALVVRFTSGGVSGAELKSADARGRRGPARRARHRHRHARRRPPSRSTWSAARFEVSGGRPRALAARSASSSSSTRRSRRSSTSKRGAIRFYPDGSSTGGRITVASGERKFLVDVDWLTGRVSIKEGG